MSQEAIPENAGRTLLSLSVFALANSSVQLLGYSCFTGPLLAVTRPAFHFQDALWLIAQLAAVLICFNALSIAGIGCLARRGLKGAHTFAAALLQTAMVVFLFGDCVLYTMLGIHLYDPAALHTITPTGLNFELPFQWTAIGAFLAACATLAAFEWAWVHRIHRNAYLASRSSRAGDKLAWEIGKRISVYAVLACFFLALGLNLDGALVPVDAMFLATLIREPRHEPPVMRPKLPAHVPYLERMTRRPNILMIAVECLRSDMIGPETMPNIDAYLHRSSCVISDNNFSGGHITSYGIFSLIYSLGGEHMAVFGAAKTPSYPLEVLRENGYQLIGLDASGLPGYLPPPIVQSQFDIYQTFTHCHENGECDARMVDWLSNFMKNRTSASPVFVFLFFYSSHHSYYYPKQFQKFKPSRVFRASQVLLHSIPDADLRAQFFNRYKNSVYYVDSLFGRLANIVARAADGRPTLLSFVGDHGEQFWEHGIYGHGAALFDNAEVKTPMFVCMPGIRPRRVALSSHVDVFPTIFEATGVHLSPSVYGDGISVLNGPDPDRYMTVVGAYYPQGETRLCFIGRDRKYRLRLMPNKIDLFTLSSISDLEDHLIRPNETDLERLHQYMERYHADFLRFEQY